MCVNIYVWIKSKFMGMFVGVFMIGEGKLRYIYDGVWLLYSDVCIFGRRLMIFVGRVFCLYFVLELRGSGREGWVLLFWD